MWSYRLGGSSLQELIVILQYSVCRIQNPIAGRLNIEVPGFKGLCSFCYKQKEMASKNSLHRSLRRRDLIAMLILGNERES